MVGLIWKSLFGQNWGRAASQLVPNNLANISLSVPVQLREQMRCLFTDRCNWKLRSAPNFALLQWTVLKNCVGSLPSLRQRDRRRVLWSFAKVTSRKLPINSSAALSSRAALQVVVAVQSRVLRWSVVSVYGVNSTIKTISRSPRWNWRRHCAVHFGRWAGKSFDTLSALHARAVWVQASRDDQWHWLEIYHFQGCSWRSESGGGVALPEAW